MQKWQGANRWMLTIAPPQNVTWQLTPYNMNKLGLLFERKGELNRAQAQYKEALQSEPANATYSYNSANIYLKKQQYDEAINYYEKAISNDSKLADAYNNLAYALCKKKENLEKAEDYVKKAITLKPENKPYYLDTLGLIYFNKGQINKAIEIYKKAVELTEKDKQALIILYTHLQQAYERKNSHKMYEIYQDKINDLKKDLTKNKG
jgi:tetratricopeptide (TPR) repeat protein